ncbi:carboxylesterase family protein [Nocardioides sp.]|uniref:carboxylesterase family protein n=1 Tax=Nocardioides sp. TaxID=35761 RepID=UPI0027226BFE|nr:carboxylesterase family protein [Nocardioides sp.]MDO9456857.1 carboxylesterase family protein [Nocardioides sp.]
MVDQVATQPRFACDAGVVVGWHDQGVVRATGIRYARAERYAAPVAEPPAPDVIEATSWSPGCPQAGSALLERMFPLGFGDVPEDEDCQRLSVTVPHDVGPDERLAVMVFLHGGSYVNGAGDAPIHDPAVLVRDERVVVVSVTYRLGLFGYLGSPDGRPANLGLLDQVEALRWVQRNIAGFGGDPDNVTAFGESAGADAVLHLMVADGAAGLFHRAIVQSAPLGITRGREAMSEAMAEEAGSIPADAPASEVVTHYERINRRARSFGLISGMPFGLQYGHAPLPREDELEAAWTAAAPGVELLIGTNSRESSFFVSEVPPLARLAEVPLVGRRLVEAVIRVTTWRIYTRDTRRFLVRHRTAGGRATRYTISWGAPGTGLAGAHTIDLALLFPHRVVWERSPVTAGLSGDEVEAAGRPVRRVWAEFARSGRVLDEGCPYLTIHG